MRTPETLTAGQRAERLRSDAAVVGTGDHKPLPESPPDMTKKISLDKERASLMSGLNLGQSSASADLDTRTEVEGSFSILSIGNLVPYRYNPRRSKNPKYAEIKDSIRADGITNALTVTRRPGEIKYFPYGGGNTRLQIAKELHDEGDVRFSKLRVVIKAWKSESDVIAAHLAENENRGDTTFWEKALGVESFKREWEAAHPGRVIIGAELNRQLKETGINYGVKTIQNFAFAIEYLGPVGPWLAALDVNTVIRPSIGGYLDLAEKLDKRDVAVGAFRSELVRHAEDLQKIVERNKQRDETERVPSELDAHQLVTEAATAIAQALGLETARMEAMTAALAERPRMAVKDLLGLEPALVTARSSTRSAPEQSTGRNQAPKAPATNSETRESSRESDDGDANGPRARAPDGATQRPLGAMPGLVGGTAFAGAGSASAQGQSVAHPTNSEEARSDRRAKLRDEVRHLFEEINKLAPIADGCSV